MKKFIAMLLAVVMVLSLVACGGNTTTPTKPAETKPTDSTPATEPPVTDRLAVEAIGDYFNVDDWTDESSAVYEATLGEFYAYYQEALEQSDVSTRWALFAIAEAKLLESGVMLPTTCKGGNYAISRVVPRTVTSVLYGNDNYRLHQVLAATEFITAADRAELKAMWADLCGTRTWEAEAKKFMADKGYTLTDTYNMGYTSDPQTWDVLSTSRAADSEPLVNCYDGLLEYNTENVLSPAMAESYEVSEDGLTYTFKIRQGTNWVDSQGRVVAPFVADDFVAGFQHMMDTMGGLEFLVDGVIVGASEYIAGETSDMTTVGVAAPDDATLVYTLVEPCPYFVTMLGYGLFAPMSRSYYQSQGGAFGEDYDANSAGYLYGKDPDHIAYCGPYVVTNATAKNTIVFSANPQYWNAENINVHTINWKYDDGTDVTKSYEDAKAGTIAGSGLTTSTIETAKADSLFDTYAYNADTDATSYMGFFVVNRKAYANFNDATVAVSEKTMTDALRTSAAMQNVHFRRVLCTAFDRGTYNAQSRGDQMKFTNMINSYTPGTFVALMEDVTVEINGTATTFAAGTNYGEIMQAQLDADGIPFMVWNKELNNSTGYDGWYNPEYAKSELELAISELAAQGVEVSAENPIIVDLPVFTGSTLYVNRGNALKQSLEAVTEGKVILNLVSCESQDDWLYAGYYPDYGYEMNADMMDVSGWGPDYGDPKSYLDTMLPDYAGFMVKSIGMF